MNKIKHFFLEKIYLNDKIRFEWKLISEPQGPSIPEYSLSEEQEGMQSP